MSDVIIIGAGAVGSATAMELVKQGAQVTLIDRSAAGTEASWAGGGILFPLLPWRYREEVNRLALAGMAAFPDVVDELRTDGHDPEYLVSGMLVHPEFEPAPVQAWCREHAMPAKFENDRLWLPDVAQVRNPRLLNAMRQWLIKRGVRLLEQTEVTALNVVGDKVGTIAAGGTKLDADHFVVTAGAWSKSLLGEYAIDRELKPMRGQMLLYEATPGLIGQIQYRNDFYLVPRRDGHILAGSTVEDVGFDKGTTETAGQELHRKAVELLPALGEYQPIRHWSGLRPGSPDNIPVIGRHPMLQNLWLNTGHFRYGVTMSPASAKLIVDLMQNLQPALDMRPYTP